MIHNSALILIKIAIVDFKIDLLVSVESSFKFTGYITKTTLF